jgi:hypothetical protein
VSLEESAYHLLSWRSLSPSCAVEAECLNFSLCHDLSSMALSQLGEVPSELQLMIVSCLGDSRTLYSMARVNINSR